jgi:hypothetical protein
MTGARAREVGLVWSAGMRGGLATEQSSRIPSLETCTHLDISEEVENMGRILFDICRIS